VTVTTVLLLAALVAALLAPLLVGLVRTRSLGALAVRNLRRRPAEAALVIAGSLLGTAIITSSFVVGDVVDGSITDVARTQLGPVDVTLTPADPADRDAVVAAVEAADLDAVAGVLPARRATVALEAPAADGRDARVVPSTSVVELDSVVARDLGDGTVATGLEDLPPTAARARTVVLHDRTAERLDVASGDRVRLHAYGATTDLTVAAVVEEVGLAGFGGAIVAPGTFGELATDLAVSGGGDAPAAAPPEALALVALAGDGLDTRELSASVLPDLRAAVADLPGVQVDDVKASMLDDAEREGGSFSELFSSIGSFSVLAGVLLLVNLFVMLAEERKTELGMLRAIGFTRRRLTRAFALEGALYAVIAAALGAVVGLGVGWVVALAAGSIFGIAEQGITFRLVIEPTSLALGGLLGLTMSLVTVWLTSLRIARLNVIRAIRDLPEPTATHVSWRALALGALGALAGAGLATWGWQAEQPIPLLAGVPLAAFAATPLLRRLLPERAARLLAAGTALAWGIGVFGLAPAVLGQADLPVFVVQGVVLTAAAVSLTATLDTVWTRVVERAAAGGRGLALRLGLAYPLARRGRTSMLLGMFSLVIFTMTFIAALSSTFTTQAERFTDETRGGYDLLVDTNPANPVDRAQLLAADGVTEVASLTPTWARFTTDFTAEPRGWTLTGFDEDLVAGGVPALSDRDPAFGDDAAAYAAVLADPELAIVPDGFLQDGGPSSDRVRVGDTVEVLDPVTGSVHTLTAIGLSSVDFAFNGVLVGDEVVSRVAGPQAAASRHYLGVADGTDVDALAASLDARLLAHGADATGFAAMVDEGLRQQNAFLYLLQAFLGLGLLVGIAGLGVVMVRAVRERRQQIGMLRAMGGSTALVRSAFLAEAAVIAVQGTVIGAVLGLVTARQVVLDSDAFGGSVISFAVPWLGLVAVVVLPVLAALAATAWPAARAAAIRPAVALRTAD
jgi:putative ABC transport system permease protein